MLKKFLNLLFFVLITNTASAQTNRHFLTDEDVEIDQNLNMKSSWSSYSNPNIVSPYFTYKLSELPLIGMVKSQKRFWSDDYWGLNRGLINRRWHASVQIGFNLKSPSKTQALSMSEEEIATLGPTEKFDLLMGRYDYPLVKEVNGHANPNAEGWNGICHGWSPASLLTIEPKNIVRKNPDGINIAFGSSDIKALISYYHANYVDEKTKQVGLRCNSTGASPGCGDDLNAGAFHVIMVNRLALLGVGFLADVEPKTQVWNQPVIGFESTIESSIVRFNSSRIVINTHLYFITEVEPSWFPITGTEANKISQMDLKYELILDNEGKIIGGNWISESRPDFLWFRESIPTFKGSMTGLNALYQASIR